MTHSSFPATVRTQAELEELWRRLIGYPGVGTRTLYFLVIDGDRPIPQLVQIDDLPRRPEPADVEGLSHILSVLDNEHAPGTGVAFLLARPGRGGASAQDRTWAASLHDAARAAGVACDTVHVATDDRLVPIPLDDLGVRTG